MYPPEPGASIYKPVIVSGREGDRGRALEPGASIYKPVTVGGRESPGARRIHLQACDSERTGGRWSPAHPSTSP
ncbi:hypothetical protein NDU88_000796 [Pleurodeles waltl]|uniref:Uncharacterized protein n=1 Tax=Pleurodeles waltl TaxID=8319 RepID=A0AAV7LVX9_PLEWA|nr:hypothetical protein NDU88_000796 [Pleurodeles waltl]